MYLFCVGIEILLRGIGFVALSTYMVRHGRTETVVDGLESPYKCINAMLQKHNIAENFKIKVKY